METTLFSNHIDIREICQFSKDTVYPIGILCHHCHDLNQNGHLGSTAL